MIANYFPSHDIEITEREIRFFVDSSGGLAFPCDEQGNPIFYNQYAKANYEDAIQHPERFPYEFNKVHQWTRYCREPASGVCKCGERIYLTNQYLGACSCPNCGQWYNLFGQELLPPEKWEED